MHRRRRRHRVDVVGVFREPKRQGLVSVTLLQNVIVLATGKITGTTNVNLIPEHQREYNNITLINSTANQSIISNVDGGNISVSAQNLASVHARHQHVQDDQLGMMRLGFFQRAHPIGDNQHMKTSALEERREAVGNGRVVVC